MGRPPNNGTPSFRFNPTEVAEMEAILQAHNNQLPSRDVLDSIAEKFSNSAERSGNKVQMKQVWNWFQNRRYAIRAKAGKAPGELGVTIPQKNSTSRSVPQAPHLPSSSPATVRNMPQASMPSLAPISTVQSADWNGPNDSQMEFEARSARDGAWYDVENFLSQRVESGDLEVLVCFAGFGTEEDEWVNVCRNVRQRSLPCESSECVAVLPGDLILCFQEGKEQALYFDAHVMDVQRRRHDVRGCRCRFLVCYDHDQYEEIVPLRKVCRRPDTDYRLQQLHAESAKVNQQRTVGDIQTGSVRVYPPEQKEQQKTNVHEVKGARVLVTSVTEANDQLKNVTDSDAGKSVKVNPHAETIPTRNMAAAQADDKGIVTQSTQTALPVSVDTNVLPAKSSETNTSSHANVSATREPNMLPPDNASATVADSETITDVAIASNLPSDATGTGGAATSAGSSSSGGNTDKE